MTALSAYKPYTGIAPLILAFFIVFIPPVNPPDPTFRSVICEDEFLSELNECTTGIASGPATPDGRPLLWKNRDVGGSQEFHYVDDGRIPFISITYEGEEDEYFGGINAAGFGVENSNSSNLGRARWGSDDDGEIHYLALATCRTVDDFQAILDSTNEEGRTLNSNYGTIDAFGGAAIFETSGYYYTRYDAIDADGGILVRSNYSYSGSGLEDRANLYGGHRHDRALILFRRGLDNGELTPKYLFQQVIRDLTSEGIDPYPLPFDGYADNYPYGCVPNNRAICRSSTAGVLVAQGVRSGEDPNESILWAMVGNPYGAITLPLWVRAGSVPEEFDDNRGSRICDRARTLKNWITAGGDVDTWKLRHPNGCGLWDFTYRLEDWVFEKTKRFVNSPRFSLDQVETFQNITARQVADSLDAWEPSYDLTEIFELIRDGNNIRLIWEEPERIGFAQHPRGYNLYRSGEPFRNGESGNFIAYVEETSYIDREPLNDRAFYRIEVVF